MPSINELLAERDAELVGESGDVARAQSRLDLSKAIGERYSAFNLLRAHLIHGTALPDTLHGAAKDLLERLVDDGYLKTTSRSGYRPASHEAGQYLRGDWLEELAYFAMLEAGVDECYFRQHIKWRVGAFEDDQEIDVIARRGDELSFTSCKTANPKRLMDSVESKKYRTFLLEAEYWDRHFTDGKGRVLLLVTRDLIDEANTHAPRHPTLFARAEVLDVDLIGLDFFNWDNLVKKFKEHWD